MTQVLRRPLCDQHQQGDKQLPFHQQQHYQHSKLHLPAQQHHLVQLLCQHRQ
jgi:hypothetical protein